MAEISSSPAGVSGVEHEEVPKLDSEVYRPGHGLYSDDYTSASSWPDREDLKTSLVPTSSVRSVDGTDDVRSITEGSILDAVLTMSQSKIYTNPQLHLTFAADFFDGYTLRQQFEFYKQSLTCTPMYFTKEGIFIVRGNGTQTLVARVTMHAREMLTYYVSEEYWNNPMHSCHVVNVSLDDFHGHIKSVAKKEGIRIYQYAEYPKIVLCQFYGGNKNADGCVQVRTETFETLSYNIDDGTTPDDPPNVKVPLAAFCASCANVARAKYPHAEFICTKSGARLIAGNETGSSSRNAHWGDCTVDSKTPVYSTKIPLDVIKALTKMSNFNTGGVLGIYCAGPGIVRLNVKIGSYADGSIYLIESDKKAIT